ncbi:MAG: MFS transporter [Desulfobacteraceae bacterium]|nr:MFS transporter [Desulfobacteraceae bacterium]
MNLQKLIPLFLGAAIGPMGGIGIITLIPGMADKWSIEFTTASLAITFYMTPFVLGQLFSGPIAQLFDTRKTLLFGFIVYASGAVLSGLSSNIFNFLGGRIIQGVGAAFLTPIIMALIGDLVPSRHLGKAIGMLGMAYTVGVTLGPFISGAIDVRYGWPWFFFLLAGLSLLSGVLYFISSAPTEKKDSQSATLFAAFSILKKALVQPGVLYLSFSAFSFFVAYIGIMTFTADYLRTYFKFPSDQIGALLSVTGISGIIVSPIAGFAGDYLGRIRVFLGSAALSLICVVLMTFIGFSYWVHFTLFLLFGTGAAGSWTTLNTMAVQACPSFRKPVTSVYNAVKFAGYAASPVILSPLYSLFQIGAVRWGCMAAILIAAILAFMAGEPSEEGGDEVLR